MSLIKKWTSDLRYTPYEDWSQNYIETLKHSVASSKWRLNYHIQPPTGLLNDPNGFSYFNGQWHLFYQAFPFGPVHGLKSWSHLTSDNLVDWEEKGTALLPDSQYDSHGVYSGSALAVSDQLFLAYTGNVRDDAWQRRSYQLGAFMDKNNQLKKITEPLIVEPPKGYTHDFRDPQVFLYEETFYLIIGAQTENKEGTVLTYTSSDLKDWQCLGELSFTKENMGFMIECPNLVFIEDKAVLLFCPQGLEKTLLSYKNIYPNTFILADSFDPERNELTQASALENLDEGFDIYATQAFNAPDGRVLSVGWVGLPEIDYPTDKEGWAHCLSLVKELKIKNNRLLQQPVAELEALRMNETTFEGSLGAQKKLAAPKENSYELEITIENSSKGILSLMSDESTNAALTLSFDTKNGTMIMNRETVGIPFAEEFETTRTFTIPKQQLFLRIFVDHSIVEVFINHGEKVATARAFPQEPQTAILLEGMNGTFSGKLWTLRSMK
jgi:beta-fructofuranosidase